MRLAISTMDKENNYEIATQYVSTETANRMKNPTTVLALRDADSRQHVGVLFVFNINPDRLLIQQNALLSVQHGMGGYLVSDQGLGEPRFTLSGTFGWRLRTVAIPDFVAKGVLGKITGKGNLIYRTPRLPQIMSDYAGEFLNGDFKTPVGQLITRKLEGEESGQVYLSGKGQTMDGMQAWFALRDLVTFYYELSEQRVQAGKAPLEMVWYDSLHSLKWVVKPTGIPSLERSVNRQGAMPYTLELVGVYDDTRPQAGRNQGLLKFWDERVN